MFKNEEVLFIKDEIFKLFDFNYSGKIEVFKEECLTINANEFNARIGCLQKSELARGLFLIAMELSSGKKEVFIKQKRHFNQLGVMLDLSRGAVYTMEAVKKFLAYMAALGMNELLMYLEDIYEVKEYPYFGYMRGRYTKEEIQEIDRYAQRLGIELIPCVQTLGHLRTYLKWIEADPVKDTADVLLVGEEKTYDFIRTLVKTLSEMFTSRRIHVGMDEAHSMGQGKYSKLHKEINVKQMFIDHLNRVKQICSEEGLSVTIWSDMLFRICGGEGGANEEYDPNSVITADVSKCVEGVNLSYWDYYRTNQDEYEGIIKRHQRFETDLSFAGAVWTWDGYLPNFRYTFDTMHPALKACLSCNVSEVYATMWGSNGTDTDYMQAVSGLPIFSEYCYLGEDCTHDDITRVSAFLTGANEEILDSVSDFFGGLDGAVRLGERLVDADLLFEILRYPVDYLETARMLKNALYSLKKYPNNPLATHGALLVEIAMEKCNIFSKLRSSYKAGEKETLEEITFKKLPYIIELYDAFFESYEQIMERNRKPFGTEVIQIRFAGIAKRLLYAKKKLESYLEGKIDIIPELEEKILSNEKIKWQPSQTYMQTM